MISETIPMSSLVLVILVVLAGCVLGTFLGFTWYRASLPPQYIYCSQCYTGHLIPNTNPNRHSTPAVEALGNSATFQRLGMKSSSRGLEVEIRQLEEERTISPATEDREKVASEIVSKKNINPKEDTPQVGPETRHSINTRRFRRSLVFPQQTVVSKVEDQSVMGQMINWTGDNLDVPPQSTDPRRQVRRRASERKEKCRYTAVSREEIGLTSQSEDEKLPNFRRYLVTNVQEITLDSSWPAPAIVLKNKPPVEELRDQGVSTVGLPVVSPGNDQVRQEDTYEAASVMLEDENNDLLKGQVSSRRHVNHEGRAQPPRGYKNLPHLQFRPTYSQSSQAQSLKWDNYGSSAQFTRI